jgi:phosphate transport system permease protein
MTLSPSAFDDDSLFSGDNSLVKQAGDDIPEKIIGSILFICAFVSVATTFGIIAIIFTETLDFFKDVTLAQFFLDTQWTPLFVTPRFGIWPLITVNKGSLLFVLLFLCHFFLKFL